MHILHLQPELKIACGITKTIYLLVKNTSQEINHSVFTFSGDAIEKFKSAGIDVVVSAKSRTGLRQAFKVFLKIFFLVRKNNINIIHCHHRYFDFIAYFISKLIKVKTVTSIQSKVYGKKLFSYKADSLIACSNSIKEHLIKYFNIDQEKIRIIYNFVDPQEVVLSVERSVLRKELGIDNQSILIGFIGRFSIREKGVDVLLEAFNRISREYKNLKLIMIGDGEDKFYINNFIADNNLNAMTLSPKENIYEYFNIIDIVVLPSQVEPFGNVAIEAGLMKKPLLASSIDGLKEIIDDGKDGILIEKGNIISLTESLRIFIEEPELRKRLGEELYNKVVNNFTSDKIIPLYKQTYQQLMKDDR